MLHQRRLAAMGEKMNFPGLDLTMKAIQAEDVERNEKKKGTPDTRPIFSVDIIDDNDKVIPLLNHALKLQYSYFYP